MRRRADSPLGPVTHDHQPAKRMRRESGGGSQSPPRSANSYRGAEDTSPRVIRTASPQRPTLPPLHPLPHMQTGPSNSDQRRDAPFQSFGQAGRATAQSQPPHYGHHPSQSWHGHRSRHSIDTPHINLKSPSPPAVTSPERQRLAAEARANSAQPANATSTPTDVVFTRDVTNRQPRSMMACMRCRRQKMKCDGPGKEPCRGCRQAGVTCVFESRTRPKSISTLPSRGSPFFGGSMPPGRGGTPGGGPGFYPPSAQPAAPITSRPTMVPDYVMRPPHPGGPGREPPMAPPQPHPNYPPPLRQHTPPGAGGPGGPGGPPPPQYYTGPPPGAPGYGVPPPGPGPPPVVVAQHPVDPRTDSRLRGLETAFRSVSTLPAAVAALQQTLNSLLRTQDALASQLAGGGPPAVAPPRAITEVPEHVWESYRVGAWPLTPWLPGISPLPGLPAHVLQCLGRRAAAERTESSRREGDAAADAVVSEISRLLGARLQWTRDEVLSLGVYATWTADSALGCLAVGLARDLQLDRPHTLRRSHDEWREWIYVVLTDHMVHLPNFDVPMVHDPLAPTWRDLVADSRPSDPSTLDRDSKLLAWLEFSELLIEVQAAQRSNDPPSPKRESTERGEPVPDDEQRQRARDIWRRFAPRWDAWAGSAGARHDPVLSLHLNYAILYTASPMWAASERVWAAVAQSHEGYAQLERARDAAIAVLQTLGSPEIGRTIAYSYTVLRPMFGLAIAHLVALVTKLSHTPIISLPHVQGQLRAVLDMLADAAPLDGAPIPPASPAEDGPALPSSLLRDMVETGQVTAIGKRDIVGAEPGRDLWRRILG
ncbi:hypothetical protein CspHIS471_0410930 [Cutaneotrichosporon sp. HIS471]|nr:hypothetical protein CspHIS471_0410930 [Cutaneotrichosporon sp. HIS471]